MEKIDMQIDEFINYCQSKNLLRKIMASYEQALRLRNNFAKRFLIAGGNLFTLSKILGHSSVVITGKAFRFR